MSFCFIIELIIRIDHLPCFAFCSIIGILIAAIFNAGKMLNVAAEGQEGPAFAEGIVTFSLISLTLAMLAVCVIVLIGLGRQMRKN